MLVQCKKCVNNTNNPTITISLDGLCNVCTLYKSAKLNLDKELEFFKSLKKEKIMVGISGGKDSTATLYLTLKMGFKPLAFTFDIGYYPLHIFPRAKEIASKFNVPHEIIDIKPHIPSLIPYQLTKQIYRECEYPEEFRRIYLLNKNHYSVKSTVIMPYVRSCQLCRKTVIRAYYAEAIKRKVNVIVLGMNEWAGLSNNQFTAIRKLKNEVYIVHLPFLLQYTINDTNKILEEIGWKVPDGELLVESNSNSCLFAKAVEAKAKKMLGFHPDSMRLSREVTVGFITKDQARKALDKVHEPGQSFWGNNFIFGTTT